MVGGYTIIDMASASAVKAVKNAVNNHKLIYVINDSGIPEIAHVYKNTIPDISDIDVTITADTVKYTIGTDGTVTKASLVFDLEDTGDVRSGSTGGTFGLSDWLYDRMVQQDLVTIKNIVDDSITGEDSPFDVHIVPFLDESGNIVIYSELHADDTPAYVRTLYVENDVIYEEAYEIGG